MQDLQRLSDHDSTASEMLALADQRCAEIEGSAVGLFWWRGALQLCRFTRPYPEKPYILAIQKLNPIHSRALLAALRRQRPLPRFNVHPRVEFEGPAYLLGLRGQTLMLLSGEDVIYSRVHPVPSTQGGFSTGGDIGEFEPVS